MHFIKTLAFLVFLLSTNSKKLFAQDEKIISWKSSIEKITDNNYKLTFTGAIKKGWHVYAAPNVAAELAGINTTREDSNIVLKNFLLLSKSVVSNSDVLAQKDLQIIADSISFTQEVNVIGKKISSFNVFVHYEVADNASFFPESDTLKIVTGETVVAVSSNRILIPTIDLDKPLSNCKTSSTNVNDKTKSKGLLSIFILGFLGGLVALLTPCVFPMIPLTVSFFTKKSESKGAGIRNAFLYGFFIFLIYVLLSIPFHFIDKLDPSILNGISTNVYLNIIFFVIFIVFALSFFGLYEITLPASFTNKTDSKAGVGNILGIFFMALTLAIVSYSRSSP